MRIVVKTLFYISVFILLLFTVLSVYIEVNKKEILANFGSQLGKKINGKISYSDADISVWKNFPFVGLHVSNAKLSDSVGRPLLNMKEISLRVSILQYFRKKTKLNNLSLKNGSVHLFTDSTGYTNKYLFDKRPDSNQQKNEVDLNGIKLRNVRVMVENRQKNKRFDITFKKLDADISTPGDLIKINIDQESLVHGLGFNLAKGSYLKEQPLEGYTKLRYDKKQEVLSFDDPDMKVNGHPYAVKGNFWFNADSFTLDVKTKQAPFEKLKNIFAENIFSDLKNVQVEKPVDVTANISGSLAYKTVPKVDAKWKVRNSRVVVPVAILSNSSFEGAFTNEVIKGLAFTDENSGVTISNFSGDWEGILLQSDKITINNLVHPLADMSLRSATDLKSLNDKLNLRTIRFLGGTASLNFHYSGPLQKDISIIDSISGNLKFSNGTIKYLPRDFTFSNCSGNIHFSSDAIRTNDLRFDLGSNHFNVDLAGTNLSALSSSDPGKAVIQCNVSTPVLNLGELRSLFASKKQVKAAGKSTGKIISATNKIDEALDHGQLKIQLSAGAVNFKNFNGRNLRGLVAFYGNDVQLSGIAIDHAEGNMTLDAKISDLGILHSTAAKVRLNNVDVAKIFKAFDDFGQDGISAQNLRGRLNANTNIAMAMDDAGNIVPGTMKGTVEFSLNKGALIDYEPMQNIKSFVFKNKNMSHVEFAELKNKLEINNYKIRIPRMEIQSTAIGMFVEGVYDLKKINSKINIQVPLKGLKKRDSTYVPQNIGLDAKTGTSIYLEGKNDKTGKVKIGLNTTRTIGRLFKKK